MIPAPPPGQGPIDPREALSPPPPPPGASYATGAAAVVGGPPPAPPGLRLPPPPFFPPPRPRRGGLGKTVLIVLLLLFLAGSVLLNLALIVAQGASGLRGHQTTLASGDVKSVVAVAPLEGIIAAKEAQKFERVMDRIENDANVKALVIRIDTPGGSVTASDEIYNRIEQFKARKDGVPVVISMGGMATSGGYYAACAGRRIFAEKTTLTGNIGVLLPRFNLSKLAEKYGVSETTIVSTGTPYKNAGSMFQREDPRDDAYLQSIADYAFARFKEVVVQGRGKLLKKDITEIADGRVYNADRAVSEGLIDKIGYLQNAWEDAAGAARLTNPRVVQFDENPTLLEMITSTSEFTHGDRNASAGGITINGVNLRLDGAALTDLLSPRLMYLWRP